MIVNSQPAEAGPASGERVLVTGGAGYVGAVLVPALLDRGYRVRVLDLCIFGREPLEPLRGRPGFELVVGDVRDVPVVREAMAGCSRVIHLACISNDPSVELDPSLSRTVNYESFGPLVSEAVEAGVRRFIHASSGSVYGISDSPDVTETHPLTPVSLYNEYKAKCEPVLLEAATADFTPVIVRPATICGRSPRQRLDLTVNILTNHAVNAGEITVFGGAQMRPNLHMQDMIELYLLLLEAETDLVRGEIFNAGRENLSVSQTAERIRRVVADELGVDEATIPIRTTPSDDPRSYHLNADKLARVLGFTPRRPIAEAARQLTRAFRAGELPDPLDDPRRFNVRWMKARGLEPAAG